MKVYKALWLVSLILMASCGQKNDSVTEKQASSEQHEETNFVSLTDAQIKTAGVEFGKVEMKNLSSSIGVNGTLAVPNQNKAQITSLVSGTLRSLRVQPGEFVNKGQIIGTIANTELSTLQQQLISITAQIKFSEQEVTRQKELVAGNAAPLKNLQKAESELQGLKAQRSAIKQQLATLGISESDGISSVLNLTAPISGNISDITAQIGSRIDANSPIAQIINNSELHLDLFVYEKDIPVVSKGQTIHFTLTNNAGKEYDAMVYSIGTAFVNETKAIPVHARVINDRTGLIEGMNVTARISIGSNVYPAVPDQAITSNGGKDYIFVITDKQGHKEEKGEHANEMNFERVQIIKGTSDVGYTEIKPVKDLSEGTRIVTKGSFFLMAKMTNTGEHE